LPGAVAVLLVAGIGAGLLGLALLQFARAE
jgi:hypothetical protein